MLVCVLHQRYESNQLLTCVPFLNVCHNKLDDPVFALQGLQATAMAFLSSISAEPGSYHFVWQLA